MPATPTPVRRRLRRTAAAFAGMAALGGAAAAALPATASAAPKTLTVKVVHNKTWGNLLELGNGRTVYRFDADPKGKSTCTGKCAKVWPPVVLTANEKVVGKGVKGFGTIKRANGAEQVSYKGLALYTFIKDKKPGQVTGNIEDSFGNWATINPAKPTAPPVAKVSGGSAPTTQASGSSGAAF